MAVEYEFTQDWFSRKSLVWPPLLDKLKPNKALEVGSFEGRSAVFLIEHCAQYGFELTCIDPWAPLDTHALDMGEVEARFDRNVALAQSNHSCVVRRTRSNAIPAMARLLSEGGPNQFDFVYIDGSHEAPDVLADAVFGFKLLRVGGIMIFDDYLWRREAAGKQDLVNMPKLAIDAFININIRKLNIIAESQLRQICIEKTAD